MIELTEKRCSDSACACGVEPLAHPRYSFGMLLEARHLALEHRYGAMRMNTHDVRLHDFGTVCGLRVDEHPSRECVDKFAILRPGIALDCCGRDIVVPEDLYVPLEDGAHSGWCGCHEPHRETKALPPGTAPAPHPPTLYVYLRYRECETDPIPTYVRECGCCSDECEHGSCVPSVIREGYEFFVSTKPPRPWRNPVANAFCAWLEARIKGPGSSSKAYLLHDRSLDEALCTVITEPCADDCDAAGDALLLATVSFDPNGGLTGIDNCTDRRLVVSTGALFGAIECLAVAVASCCKKNAFLTLKGTVTPDAVNVEQPPAKPEITYTAIVTNADATETAGAFTVALAFPPGLTFVSAKLDVDGANQPVPAGDAGGVKANVASLAAGKAATLTVVASYDPAQRKAGDAIVTTASIPAYDGDHGPPVTLTTTFVDIPIPRVIVGNLPKKLTTAKLTDLLRSLPGIVLPFTIDMDPATATANDPKATVFLEAVQDGTVVAEAPLTLEWFDPKTLHVHVSTDPTDPTATFVRTFTAKPAKENLMRIKLLGGPEGSGASGPALTANDAMRLDGAPATGGPFTGQSGNGTQGGDFVWDVVIDVPVELDGPHVLYAQSMLADIPLPDTISVQGPTFSMLMKGFSIVFDEAMDKTVPPDKSSSPPSVTVTIAGLTIKTQTTWPAGTTLRIALDRASLDAAFNKIANTGGTLKLTLTGGSKNAAPAAGVMRSADGKRSLDGDPAKGSGALQLAKKSGDGHQGGDFVWAIALTLTAPTNT